MASKTHSVQVTCDDGLFRLTTTITFAFHNAQSSSTWWGASLIHVLLLYLLNWICSTRPQVRQNTVQQAPLLWVILVILTPEIGILNRCKAVTTLKHNVETSSSQLIGNSGNTSSCDEVNAHKKVWQKVMEGRTVIDWEMISKRGNSNITHISPFFNVVKWLTLH